MPKYRIVKSDKKGKVKSEEEIETGNLEEAKRIALDQENISVIPVE